MPRDRGIVRGARRYNYSCWNAGFETNINKRDSFRHGTRSATRGNVFEEALVESANGYALWLEHVRARRTGKKVSFGSCGTTQRVNRQFH
jgi:hypothetical protein